MKVSTKGRYGLRVMMELAARYGQGPVMVEDIARSQSLSGKYIHVIAGGLRTAGLIRAVRGPAGGYELARTPATITALDIVSALEGSLAPVDCVADACSCPRSSACVSREVWQDVATAVEGVLKGRTLEDLVRRQQAVTQGPVNWEI